MSYFPFYQLNTVTLPLALDAANFSQSIHLPEEMGIYLPLRVTYNKQQEETHTYLHVFDLFELWSNISSFYLASSSWIIADKRASSHYFRST